MTRFACLLLFSSYLDVHLFTISVHNPIQNLCQNVSKENQLDIVGR